jgi:hypothetical protein
MANSDSTDPRLLRLASHDNVLVVTATLRAGEQFSIDGNLYVCTTTLPLGHKIAARAITTGEKIVKYGAPIGSATNAIACGEHVHTHDLKSDYLPTYTLERGQVYVKE